MDKRAAVEIVGKFREKIQERGISPLKIIFPLNFPSSRKSKPPVSQVNTMACEIPGFFASITEYYIIVIHVPFAVATHRPEKPI